MPRKQNGFGRSSFAFNKVNTNVKRGKVKSAAGAYPSNRRYGSTVQRTVIEGYDLSSTWVRWRKGLEFYYQAAWNRLRRLNPDYNPYDESSEEYIDFEIQSKLYQGTAGEIDVTFDGYRFATKGSDTANHYVLKRTPNNPDPLGTITQVFNDPLEHAEYKALNEIWTRGVPNANSFMLKNMIGERLTDGETEASLSYILTDQDHPAVFLGKSSPLKPTQVTVSVDRATLEASQFVIDRGGDLNSIIGELGYIEEFYTEQAITSPFRFTDQAEFNDLTLNKDYFVVNADFSNIGVAFSILDQDIEFPATLLDISSLETLYRTTNASYVLTGEYLYDKGEYQRFYGQKYLTADLVRSEVDTASFVVFPFTIQSIKVNTTTVEITSEPFLGECKLYAPIGDYSTLIWADNSFTKTSIDTDVDGNYYHTDDRDSEGNQLPQWTIIDTDVDPWATNVFSNRLPLVPAVMYTCSCPDHAHAQLRMPQATESDAERKVNRQKRYPLPTSQSVDRFTQGALSEVGGIAQSWATREYQTSYKQCKHTIAARFIERNKTKEPDSYPSVGSRIKFEEKLKAEIRDIPDEFRLSYERSGITTLEIIFSMADALNMDDAELAYVILNTKF